MLIPQGHPEPAKAADEEHLPFKLIYALSHNQGAGHPGGLRVWISPESTHSQWNDIKNSIRRSSLQHVVLLSTTLSNVAHGPYKSGRNMLSLREAAEDLAATMSDEQFSELVDLMAQDQHVEFDDESLPQSPRDIPDLKCLTTLPVFVPWPMGSTDSGQF